MEEIFFFIPQHVHVPSATGRSLKEYTNWDSRKTAVATTPQVCVLHSHHLNKNWYTLCWNVRIMWSEEKTWKVSVQLRFSVWESFSLFHAYHNILLLLLDIFSHVYWQIMFFIKLYIVCTNQWILQVCQTPLSFWSTMIYCNVQWTILIYMLVWGGSHRKCVQAHRNSYQTLLTLTSQVSSQVMS